jgi:DNA polymerase-1
MLMSYTLDSGVTNEGHGMDALSAALARPQPIPFGAVAGSGKNFIGFARVAIEERDRNTPPRTPT